MPTEREQSGHEVATERTVSNRPAIAPRNIEGRGVATERAVSNRSAIEPRSGGHILGAQVLPVPSTNVQANDATGSNVVPIYGTGSSFEILSDLFLRSFGGNSYSPAPRESERTIIESVGNNSNIVIILILGAVGFAVYYFWKKSH